MSIIKLLADDVRLNGDLRVMEYYTIFRFVESSEGVESRGTSE